MSKRKVKYARMHDVRVVIPGIGQMPNELPSQAKTIAGLEMYLCEGVLEVVTAAAGSHGIPLANVQFMTFAPEDKAPAVAASTAKK